MTQSNQQAESIQLKIIPGKSADRVPEHYKKYPAEWNAQYDMLHMDGVTCRSCAYLNRCTTLYGQKSENTSCQFSPSKFYSTDPS
jgi:hypothetical protein